MTTAMGTGQGYDWGTTTTASQRGPGSGALLRPELLVGTAVTLGLTWVVTLALFFLTDDRPERYFGERYLPRAALLALIAAPVALLVSRGEYDLSALGTVALGVYLYGEVSEDAAVGALVLCGIVGLVVGAVVGAVRWLTGASSALVSIAAGFLIQAIAAKIVFAGDAPRVVGGSLGGSGWIVVSALGVLTLALGAAVLPGWQASGDRATEGPGPTVIVGFALSGLAGCLYGGLGVGSAQLAPGQIGQSVGVLLPLFAAVAVGGVVLGAGLAAPPAAALGSLAVVLLGDIPLIRAWDDGIIDYQLLLGGTFVVCLVIANGLLRLLSATTRAPVSPAAPATPPPAPRPPPPPPAPMPAAAPPQPRPQPPEPS